MKALTMPDIIRITADYYGVTQIDLMLHRKTKTTAKARQMCMFLIKKLTDHSLTEIAYQFGGRDHTTVLYNIRRMPVKLKSLVILNEYNDLMEELV